MDIRQTLISRHRRPKLRNRKCRPQPAPENHAMSGRMTAPELLEREFLETRCKLLEVAAALDRLDRAEGSVAGDARREKIQRALDILAKAEPNRAEQLQLLFSLNYEPDWRRRFFG